MSQRKTRLGLTSLESRVRSGWSSSKTQPFHNSPVKAAQTSSLNMDFSSSAQPSEIGLSHQKTKAKKVRAATY